MMARDARASCSGPKAKGVDDAAAESSSEAVGGTPGSSTWKSERRGKLALDARPSKRKADEFDRQNGSVELRRSERNNSQSLCSSGSKKSDGSLDSSILEKKNIKEKSVSQLNTETKKVETSENRVVSDEREAKRMNSRAYRALFGQENQADSPGCDEMGSSIELSQQSNFDIIRDGALENSDSDEQLSQTILPEANAEGEQLCINSERTSEESFEELQETTIPQFADSDKEISDRTPTSSAKINGVVDHPNEKCTSTSRGPASTTEVQPSCIDYLCSICKLGGNVMCCDGNGCQTRCHQACLGHETYFTFGAWHCYSCVKKKILCGARAVSKGIESVLKSKEEEVFAGNALKGKTQYLVKYKSLAHLHNQWLLDREVLNEDPSLIEKFNETNQLTMWKGQWTVPRRLLQKHSVTSLRQKDEPTCDIVEGHYEWLVKWLGLGYEHATWELENALINSPEGNRLVTEHEKLQERVKKAQCSNSSEKKLSMEIGPLDKLPPGLDDNHLEFVNNLRKRWDAGHSSIVIDAKGRMEKIVSFILSLLSHVSCPFLIISTPDALHSWDEEFFTLAPSVDVVVYHGGKDTRKGIRMVELFEKGGFVMSQVIVTSSHVMSEDLDLFASTEWAAVFVDAGQISDMHGLLKQIKVLSSHMMLLLVNEKLKDGMMEHLQSVFTYQSDIIPCNGEGSNSNPRMIPIPKERFSKYIPQSCKPDSKFLEYWVPAGMSDIQLEQYCANLLSNSLPLWSASKKDHVGSLHHILGDARKCCDHPYLVDSSLQASLVKEGRVSEMLNVGIKASGKLQLLDMMLSEIKSRSLKVLVLFQTGISPGKVSIGDILDDFVRQRYGNESYERCDGIIDPTKRQAAVQKFNQCDERFIFLLETRACGPAIKLSLDCIIFFCSNLSPMHDIRNLQRLTIDSKSEKMKVFRLYSSLTLEEKALILAREDNNVEYKVQNSNSAACHVLLMWGALFLFEKLVKFHSRSSLAFNEDLMFEQLRPENIIKEFVAILDQNGKDDKPSNCSVIVEVQALEVYSTNAHLPGELKIRPIDDVEPHLFWKKLLDIKQPLWRYPSSFGAERKRKRVPCSQNDPQLFDGGLKKQKKAANKTRPPLLGPPSVQGNMTGSSRLSALDLSTSLPMSSKPGLSDTSSEAKEVRTATVTGRIHLSESQESLHSRLKLEISALSGVLKLPENVKAMVEDFLGYVMGNHHVTREPETILQAFQLSLCWTAASILKYRLDHKESVSLARQHLKFGCKKEDVEYVYSMLRCLKSVFLYRTGRLEVAVTASTPYISSNELSKEALNARSLHPSWANVIEHTATAPLLGLAQKDLSKSIQDIEKKCTKQMTKLLEKQQKELEAVQCSYNDEKTLLENKKKTERAVIRCHRKGAMEANQLKLLEDKYAEKFDNLKSQMETRLKHLEESHEAAREQLLERKSHLIEGLKSWAQVELVNKLEKDPENAISQMSCSMNQISEGPSLEDGQQPLKDLNAGCTSTSGDDGPAQVDDDVDRRGRHILLAVPCRNPAEISQPNINICITNPENSMMEELEAHQREQQDINHNCQFSGETTEVTSQIRGAPLDVEGTTSMAKMGGDLSRENLGVSLVSSSECTGQASDFTLEIPEVPSNLTEVAELIIDDTAGRENHGDAISLLHCGSRRDELADMVPSQVPKVLSTLPEIATDEDIGSRENNVDAVMQLHCDSRCDAQADVVPSQVTEVPSTLMEVASDVIVDVNAGGGNNGDAVVQVHCGSRCDEPAADLVPSQVPETSHVIEEGEVNVRRVGEVSAFSSGGIEVSHQLDEPADCNQNRGLPRANSPPLLPTLASAEESCMPSSLALHEEYDQPAQEDRDLGISSHLLVEVIDTPVVSELAASFSSQHPGGTSGNQSDFEVLGTRTSLNNGIPPIQTASAVRMPATLSMDPLQKELEIIKKEKEETIRTLENMKLQLKSDCEKEIQEVVAKIRRNYEVKIQETESTFLLKKKELDVNYLTVLKNKMVAEAFKSKCMDTKVCASNSSSTRQGMAGNSRRQLHLASSQPPSVRPPTTLSPAYGGSTRTIMPNGLQASTAHSNMPFHQVAGPSLSPSPSRAAAPPCVSPSPSIGNLQGSHQIYAPVHPQHFRPMASVSTASPSMSRGMSNQQVLGTVIGTPMLPPFPPNPSVQLRSHGPEIMVNRLHGSNEDFPPSNSSSHARESMGLENRTNSSTLPPSNMPSTTQLTSNLEALQLNLDTMLLNPPRDVVCLSDDE